jgi:thiol-disulfide isomerase/thioredoxin
MRGMAQIVGAAAVGVALSFGAWGQDSKADEGPDPAAILKGADEALGKLESLSYKASSRGVGSKATRTPEVDALVRAVRIKKDPLGWKFLSRGEARKGGEEPRAFTVSYDGKVVRSIREWERKVIEGPPAASDEPMGDGAGWAMTWLLRWNQMVHAPFGTEDGHAPCRYEGVVVVGGEPCDVVYVDYSDAPDPTLFDAWWYISRKDSLPRRLDMHFVENMFGDGFTTLVITELEAGAPLADGQLAVMAPGDFEVVKAKEKQVQPEGRAVAASGIPVGEIAPDFALKDPEGREHKLSDYRGKVVLLDFWATWCGPCQMAMPGIQKVHERFKGQGVVVFGMNCWESGDAAAFMREKGYTYGLLLNADETATKYNVSGIPTFYIVGPDGRVMHSAVGFDPALEETLGVILERGVAP